MENETLENNFNTNNKLKLPKDVGLYWIHCNRCYEIYIRKRRRILLLSCNHTICEKCVADPSVNTINGPNEVNCPICQKVQRFRVLCNIMPAHAKELLNPEPWREPTERILNFQAKQRQNFKRGMFRKHSELQKIKRKCKLLQINSKKKYEKYEQLQYERKQLEREVRKRKEQEQPPQSIYYQPKPGDSYNNGLFNMNSFPGANKGKSELTIPRNRAQNPTRNILNNSFTLMPDFH